MVGQLSAPALFSTTGITLATREGDRCVSGIIISNVRQIVLTSTFLFLFYNKGKIDWARIIFTDLGEKIQ